MAAQMMPAPMMPAHGIFDMEDVIKKVLQVLEDNGLILNFESVKDRIKASMLEVLRHTLISEGRLMRGYTENTPMAEVGKGMTRILGADRVDLIKRSFAIETYRIKIVEVNGQLVALVHRKGIAIEPDITLSTIESIEKAIELQWASFVLELLVFLLSCVGIIVDLSVDEIKKIVQLLKTNFAQVSVFKTAFNKCVEAWKEAECNVWGKAKAIFYFMKDSYSTGIFWKIIKLVFTDTSTWEKIREIAGLVLMIVTAFTTEWLVLLAKLALALDNVGYLAEKIENLLKFSDMKKALQ